VQKILLLGKPKAGKTTLVKKVLAGLAKTAYGGFFTEEIREKGERVGFKITSTNGEESILAHINPTLARKGGVNHKSPYRVSKYYVNVSGFEQIALKAISRAEKEKDLIIIDEIGKMELFSQKFVNKIEEIFTKGRKKALATIPVSNIPLVKKLQSLSDTEVVEVTERNRDRLVSELINKLE